VAQDNEYATWSAWGNQYWPAKYLIDARGRVRYSHFGEGNYRQTEDAIRALLREAGARRLGAMAHARVETPSRGLGTPETYLGAARAQGFSPPPQSGIHTYERAPDDLPKNTFALGGTWNVEDESATALQAARLDAEFVARRVFLVLSSRDRIARPVRVLLDGRAVPAADAGSDVHGSVATVRSERLYRLISLPAVGRHRLTLELAPGVTGYAFTFG
jgi:hypothetical protein